MNHHNAYFRYLKPVLTLFFTLIVAFTLSRISLMLWQQTRIETEFLIPMLVGGLRVDLSSSAYLSLPLLLLLMLHQFLPQLLKPLIAKVGYCYSVAIVVLVVMCEASTPAFINQYDVRPNRLFIEYLTYPKEVFSMLTSGHLASLVFVFITCILVTHFYRKLVPVMGPSNHLNNIKALLVSFPVLLLLVLMARGTTGHRPLNPSLVYFSQDALVNALTLNSPYSVAFALKNMKNEENVANLYGKMDESEMFNLVKQASHRTYFVSDDLPTLSVNPAYQTQKKKNLVIILEESLGARFVGALGGAGITPELDKLYNEGWGFNHLYATGTRSVRGIEAIVTGFPPSPSQSVVKLSKSQHQFYTIADTLSREGYSTQFIYGGESHFDNMKSFFIGNGFQDIVDFNNIESPTYIASWGACDADLFTQADKELSQLAKSDNPFFSLIFTSSNHDPFDIPAHKVSLPEDYQSDDIKRDLAVKYADYALGKFIEKAKQQDYWEDTVFLVVADHDIRAYGTEPVPIKSFHIPGVILNSGLAAQRDDRLVSQLDLPVTLLSLIGVETASPMTGFDLTKQYPVERAMMQYYNNFAYIENNEVAILMPGEKVSYWRYDSKDKKQTRTTKNAQHAALLEKAKAHVLFSSAAYQKSLFKLPDASSNTDARIAFSTRQARHND
ncbi:LTA synthase family protein [Alteromonas sp. a30]|uniref:LTA synthase family protein n=1 Tax=Alteromonas sp. a30 TaxID=2730917 RepID=UPI0022828C3A|nr:LTA synthase family protein [Alteromonas sp. a30]MCY7295901.1 LTA synthase family protein [Alteromonas sp. a30]